MSRQLEATIVTKFFSRNLQAFKSTSKLFCCCFCFEKTDCKGLISSQDLRLILCLKVSSILISLVEKKGSVSPFYGWVSTVSRLQRHYVETIYFLLQVPWSLKLLVWSDGMAWPRTSTYFGLGHIWRAGPFFPGLFFFFCADFQFRRNMNMKAFPTTCTRKFLIFNDTLIFCNSCLIGFQKFYELVK